ncbi:hypothetical protein H0H81_004134 [Sphagnurus paluster]|uniref:Uncharacterized protein n=1 Tax=Sphagnurus paluster TaxID=117069 RepID=A0A9P7FZ98_9AGAR|nr:hypothetical protein H0H81_004134 [Sphagnurus paluster]
MSKTPNDFVDENPRVTGKPTLEKQTVGVWTILSLKESFVESLNPTHYWATGSKYLATLPVVRRFVVDVYTLNPPLVLLYFIREAWKGIEPGITVYISSQLFITVKPYSSSTLLSYLT